MAAAPPRLCPLSHSHPSQSRFADFASLPPPSAYSCVLRRHSSILHGVFGSLSALARPLQIEKPLWSLLALCVLLGHPQSLTSDSYSFLCRPLSRIPQITERHRIPPLLSALVRSICKSPTAFSLSLSLSHLCSPIWQLWRDFIAVGGRARWRRCGNEKIGLDAAERQRGARLQLGHLGLAQNLIPDILRIPNSFSTLVRPGRLRHH